MLQLILHMFGDYVTQSDWMANNKRKSSLAAWTHALVYSLPFLLLTWKAPSPALAGATILITHFLIDRFGLARYVVWAKNWLGPSKAWYCEPSGVTDVDNGIVSRFCTQPVPPFDLCQQTGYPPNRPIWLTMWLLIAADNTLHLAINYLSLKYL